MNKKSTRAKNWMREHSFEIFYGAVIVGSIGAYVGLTILAVKQEEAAVEARRRLQDWIFQENLKGRSVVQLANGDYMSFVPTVD